MNAARSLRTLALMAGCSLLLVGTPSFAGGYCGGRAAFIAGGGPLYRAGSLRTPRSRLYRHQSGYLLGYQRPRFYNVDYGFAPYGGYGGYGGFVSGPVVVPLPTADTPCSAYPSPQQSLDCRRERLLQAATRIDVTGITLSVERPVQPAETQPELKGAGWTFLTTGEPVKALGRFTAELMRAPASGRARIGFALASAMFDDDRTAAAAMRAALVQDPAAVRDFPADARIEACLRGLQGRYADRDGDDEILMAAVLHVLLRERDEAATDLARLPAPDETDAGDGGDPALATLRAIVGVPAPDALASRE